MDITIRRELLRLAQQRGPGKTFCPSEVARAVDPETWRERMAEVREAASTLCSEGVLQATQGGRVVDLVAVKGPVRLGLPKQERLPG